MASLRYIGGFVCRRQRVHFTVDIGAGGDHGGVKQEAVLVG